MDISNQYWTSMNIEQESWTDYKLSMAVQKKWFALHNHRTHNVFNRANRCTQGWVIWEKKNKTSIFFSELLTNSLFFLPFLTSQLKNVTTTW